MINLERAADVNGLMRLGAPMTGIAMDEINQVAATTGNDPDLDTLLLRLHTEYSLLDGANKIEAMAVRAAELGIKDEPLLGRIVVGYTSGGNAVTVTDIGGNASSTAPRAVSMRLMKKLATLAILLTSPPRAARYLRAPWPR